MTSLEIVGQRAVEYTQALTVLRSAKYDLLSRMALFDKTFNDQARVTRNNPMYEQLEVFCFDQFKAKDLARSAVNNAKKRLVNAVLKQQKEAA